MRLQSPDFDDSAFLELERFQAVLGDWGYSSDHVCRHVNLAFKLLRAQKIRCLGHGVFLDDELDDTTIFVLLYIHADVDQISTLSDQLYALLDQSVSDWNPARLSISFEPYVLTA